MVLSPAARRRATLALDMMLRSGIGVESAASRNHTTRRTVLKFLDESGIPYVYSKGIPLKIVRTPQQEVKNFLTLMHEGKSATAAAKKLGVPVSAMRKMRLKTAKGGHRLIIRKNKKTGRWEANFVPLYEHSMVVHGKLIGFRESVQGRGQLEGPDATNKRKKKKPDKDYTDIWWQVDFNNFQSTLPAESAGEYWKPAIVQHLKGILESANITHPSLSAKFLSNTDVSAHANTHNRVDAAGQMKLSMLEELLERYDLRMSPKVSVGVDDNFAPRTTDFLSTTDLDSGQPRQTSGPFQVFFLTTDSLNIYPKTGSINITFDYNLSDERVE